MSIVVNIEILVPLFESRFQTVGNWHCEEIFLENRKEICILKSFVCWQKFCSDKFRDIENLWTWPLQLCLARQPKLEREMSQNQVLVEAFRGIYEPQHHDNEVRNREDLRRLKTAMINGLIATIEIHDPITQTELLTLKTLIEQAISREISVALKSRVSGGMVPLKLAEYVGLMACILRLEESIA